MLKYKQQLLETINENRIGYKVYSKKKISGKLEDFKKRAQDWTEKSDYEFRPVFKDFVDGKKIFYFAFCDLDSKIPIRHLISNSVRQEIWKYIPDIEKLYPHIKSFVGNLWETDCSSCDEIKKLKIIDCIVDSFFDMSIAQLELIKKYIGDDLIDRISDYQKAPEKFERVDNDTKQLCIRLARQYNEQNSELTRQCKECCLKHLRVVPELIAEYIKTPEYEQEWDRACAHLTLAEDHVLQINLQFAQEIRKVRLRTEKKNFDNDYRELINKVKTL